MSDDEMIALAQKFRNCEGPFKRLDAETLRCYMKGSSGWDVAFLRFVEGEVHIYRYMQTVNKEEL